MSRLQVGGLAILIKDGIPQNIGKVVKLVSFHESIECTLGMLHLDEWEFSCESGVVCLDGKLYFDGMATSYKNLIPLGDKQTQDELAKEKENDPITSDAL